MSARRRLRLAGGFLALLALVAVVGPGLGLRDAAAQPDGLVLRDLPPWSRVAALRLADGGLRYADAVRPTDDGGAEYRRAGSWHRLDADELAGAGSQAWETHPLFVLGTDGYGRDLLSRLVVGARVSLAVGVAAALIALLLGTLVGAAAGLGGGWIDALLMRATDVALAVPRLFLALLLVALWRPSLTTTVLVLAGTTWMGAARLVRGEILSLRERPFVEAARAGGAPPLRLALGHLLPSALTPLTVEAAFRVGDSILLESALSFLGLGVPAPAPSWGNLIADGRHALLDAWWIATLPGLAIAATVIALQVLGDASRDRLAPRG